VTILFVEVWTRLCGQVRDQTALLGILHRLRELKTELISVECLNASATA
jgi:hypothetical protein